jgi:hypothetical protein
MDTLLVRLHIQAEAAASEVVAEVREMDLHQLLGP